VERLLRLSLAPAWDPVWTNAEGPPLGLSTDRLRDLVSTRLRARLRARLWARRRTVSYGRLRACLCNNSSGLSLQQHQTSTRGRSRRLRDRRGRSNSFRSPSRDFYRKDVEIAFTGNSYRNSHRFWHGFAKDQGGSSWAGAFQNWYCYQDSSWPYCQPNNGGNAGNQDCLSMYGDGTWNDLDCGLRTQAYVVEYGNDVL